MRVLTGMFLIFPLQKTGVTSGAGKKCLLVLTKNKTERDCSRSAVKIRHTIQVFRCIPEHLPRKSLHPYTVPRSQKVTRHYKLRNQ